MTTDARSRALTALVSCVTATAYYAVPDFVPSRTARGWIKAGLLVAGAGTTLPTARGDLADIRSSWSDAMHGRTPEGSEPAATEGTDTDNLAALDAGAAPEDSAGLGPRVGAVVAAGTVVVATTVAVVAGERWIYRRGEARAAAGVRYAHTRSALVMGALSAVLTLVAEVAEARSGTSDPS